RIHLRAKRLVPTSIAVILFQLFNLTMDTSPKREKYQANLQIMKSERVFVVSPFSLKKHEYPSRKLTFIANHTLHVFSHPLLEPHLPPRLHKSHHVASF